MMKLFITLSKRNLAVLLALVIICLILAGQFFTIRSSGTDGSTNAARVSFISGLGYKINETATLNKSITVPKEFGTVYEKYNGLQKKAGFDLSLFKGKAAQIYTYECLENEDTVINIIVCDGCIIGGDVSSVRLDGEMNPLLPSD